MKIVLDSNVLFSALIKDSLTRRLVLDYSDVFFFPSYIFEEYEEHKTEILKKSKMSEHDFEQLLSLLLKKVVIVPPETLLPYRDEAYTIVKDIDKDDAVLIACCLAFPESVLWSDDKKLKLQNKVRVVSTPEMNVLMEG